MLKLGLGEWGSQFDLGDRHMPDLQPGVFIHRYGLIAACMMHIEGYYSIKSIAFKNNNPGNIEEKGKYKIYPNKIAGYTDLVRDIALNKGMKLKDFIAKYAPPSENDTNSYISILSSLTGIAPEETI